MIQIAVIGSGRASPVELKIAEKVGAEIAQAGHILVCGGLGGVMEAAARGAKSKGGLTLGILPGESKSEANKYIDIWVVSAMSHARNAIIARTADALIAVGGGPGTLSEIALGLKIGKPVIVIEGALPRVLIESEGIVKARSPEEALFHAQRTIVDMAGA